MLHLIEYFMYTNNEENKCKRPYNLKLYVGIVINSRVPMLEHNNCKIQTVNCRNRKKQYCR